ncbi:tetratricopeptide (TPR) repeat protein [Rubricella aquisinus]|uniref:Tetratricopeptide (TPR) repeat protein n=1 Tax=Rubricella aquisinus TaxID=2028108 RepID=A0A840WHM6_9RHOB|nr:tetratricopeptide repeat protein [Rubricella aquisinus]MBB5514628.1 tetratricopeptide (TPR) repeat protein [Rubricella aquisinus]
MGESKAALHVRLLGSFHVKTESGEDLTPRGAKARGVLALVLLAPDMKRPRAYLRDMLWSDRGPEQGSSSLRQAIAEIKRYFGDYADVLQADNRSFGLDPTRIVTDMYTDPPQSRDIPYLFEDLMIRDPVFNKWLTERRADRAPAVYPTTYITAQIPRGAEVQYIDIPRLTVSVGANETGKSGQAQEMARSIVQSIRDWGAVDVIHAGDTDADDLDGFTLNVGRGQTDQMLSASMSYTQGGRRRFLWGQSYPMLTPHELRQNQFINLCVDRAIFALVHDGPKRVSGQRATLNSFVAVDYIFRRKGKSAEESRDLLEQCFQRDRRGIHLAWQAFQLTYTIGERRAEDRDAVKDEARQLIHRAIELEPNNAMVLCIGSYVHSFLLGHFNAGHDLASRSVALNPANPIGWAFLSAVEGYQGGYEEAHSYSTFARNISGEGSYRYMIDAMCCVTATISGRFDEAISVGEAVHSLNPDYAPPMRYLAAVYAITGQPDRARDMVQRLQRIEPDFTLGKLLDATYPTAALRLSGRLSETDIA